MTGSAFAALLGVWLAAIASPGPDVVQIIRVGSRDRAAGIAWMLWEGFSALAGFS